MEVDLRPISYQDFYAKIGLCVTEYQSIEDMLVGAFIATLGGDQKRASAIFAVISQKGLELKLSLIAAAALDLPSISIDRWQKISAGISQAAEFRNKIAHGRSTLFGGGITVQLGDGGEFISAKRDSEPRMQIHKRSKRGNEERIEITEMESWYAKMMQLAEDLRSYINDTRRIRGL